MRPEGEKLWGCQYQVKGGQVLPHLVGIELTDLTNAPPPLVLASLLSIGIYYPEKLK